MTAFSTMKTWFALRNRDDSDAKNQVEYYDMLQNYYDSNGLYQSQLAADFYNSTWNASMKSLRTVANRAVEFYVAKLEPGTVPQALPLLADNERIIEPIQQVWLWSNLAQNKPVWVRNYATLGDLFIKVVGEETKVFFQRIDPRDVTSFTEDVRGNVTVIRLDQSIQIENLNKTRTEIWDSDGYRVYIHLLGLAAEEKYLGAPVEQAPLSVFGIDFVPWAHAKFKDVGDDRGACCFSHALDKIDEANRVATRLHEILFRYNKPLWAIGANAMDAAGRPLPPPKVGNATGKLEIEDDTIISLPGMAAIAPLVPNIQYGPALDILRDTMSEVERDLPELGYSEQDDKLLSGVALRLKMGPASERVLEARANFEAALIKADNMALTIGGFLGLKGFDGLGDYDSGDFEHSFTEREVVPVTDDERAATLKVLKDAGIDLKLAMELAGFDETIIARVKEPVAPVIVQAQRVPPNGD